MPAKPASSIDETSGASPANAGGAGPKHVAIIMDGNGRWAAARDLPRAAGHREGVEAAPPRR